jgi:hypothetical protein
MINKKTKTKKIYNFNEKNKNNKEIKNFKIKDNDDKKMFHFLLISLSACFIIIFSFQLNIFQTQKMKLEREELLKAMNEISVMINNYKNLDYEIKKIKENDFKLPIKNKNIATTVEIIDNQVVMKINGEKVSFGNYINEEKIKKIVKRDYKKNSGE